MQAVARLPRVVDGRPRIIPDPPLLVPVGELIPAETDRKSLEARLVELIPKYRRTLETDRRYLLEQFEFAAMAPTVLAVASVGPPCPIPPPPGPHPPTPPPLHA